MKLPELESLPEAHPLRISESAQRFNATPNQPDSSHDRVVVFIDGANLFYAALQLGIEIDYVKLLACLIQGRHFVRAYFYTGVDPQNDKQQGFLHWMRRNGYRVVAKELIQFPDGSRKANLEVEIAVDMLTLAQYCDTVVLLSGDGDLSYAVNALSYQGIRVEVVSLHAMTSDTLINVADCYTDLTSIQTAIQRSPAVKP
jgi:uncharacterized LabA/DUF88 family protein